MEKWCTFGSISIYLAYGDYGLADTTAQGQGLEPAKSRRQSFINLVLTTGIAKSESVAEALSKSRPNDGRARSDGKNPHDSAILKLEVIQSLRVWTGFGASYRHFSHDISSLTPCNAPAPPHTINLIRLGSA